MLVKHWEPLDSMFGMDRGWKALRPPGYFNRPRADNGVGSLDVFRKGDDLVVQAAMPGIKPEDMEVTIVDNTLTIKGESKAEAEVKDADYVHRELRFGSFKRVVNLSEDHLADKAQGHYENGVLTVTIPKGEKAKATTVKVSISK